RAHDALTAGWHPFSMGNKHTKDDNRVDHVPGRTAGNEIDESTAARPGGPTKPAARMVKEQLVKHNPAQGSPSIRKNPEAGKPKQQPTNRGPKLGPNDDS